MCRRAAAPTPSALLGRPRRRVPIGAYRIAHMGARAFGCCTGTIPSRRRRFCGMIRLRLWNRTSIGQAGDVFGRDGRDELALDIFPRTRRSGRRGKCGRGVLSALSGHVVLLRVLLLALLPSPRLPILLPRLLLDISPSTPVCIAPPIISVPPLIRGVSTGTSTGARRQILKRQRTRHALARKVREPRQTPELHGRTRVERRTWER